MTLVEFRKLCKEIKSIKPFNIKVLDSKEQLPENAELRTIYIVPSEEDEESMYDEYIYIKQEAKYVLLDQIVRTYPVYDLYERVVKIVSDYFMKTNPNYKSVHDALDEVHKLEKFNLSGYVGDYDQKKRIIKSCINFFYQCRYALYFMVMKMKKNKCPSTSYSFIFNEIRGEGIIVTFEIQKKSSDHIDLLTDIQKIDDVLKSEDLEVFCSDLYD